MGATGLDRRADQSPIKDQGRRAACVAFAATAGHELLRREGVDLAEEFLHWAAKQRDGLPAGSEGTTLAAAAAGLAELGQPPEALWPYDEARDAGAPGYAPPEGACDAARARRVRAGGPLASTSAALRQALDRGLAVLLGLRIHLPWYEAGPDGRIAMPRPGATAYGGHAVLVVGYRAPVGGGDGSFIVRNSWGRSWGEDGYGYLPDAYVEQHGLAAWALAPEEPGGPLP